MSTVPQRIVVGVDGSEPSFYAIRQAAELAVALNCSLEAIMTWEFSTLYDPRFNEWTPDADVYPQREAEGTLAKAVEGAFCGGPPVPIQERVVRGQSARALIHESKRARMLVLGSRGHGGFAGLLLGSVSAACAAHAQCPVLIVHAPREHQTTT